MGEALRLPFERVHGLLVPHTINSLHAHALHPAIPVPIAVWHRPHSNQTDVAEVPSNPTPLVCCQRDSLPRHPCFTTRDGCSRGPFADGNGFELQHSLSSAAHNSTSFHSPTQPLCLSYALDTAENYTLRLYYSHDPHYRRLSRLIP